LYQPLEKTKLDCRKKIPQANAVKRRDCFKQSLTEDAFRENPPTNAAQMNKLIISQETSTFPAGHVPSAHVGRNH
jgi:hypothetical protein